MGQNSVPQVRLRAGPRWRGGSLPYVRPYCTRSLGPKIPAGACRRPFCCSERPGPGLGRPEGAQNALKWPKITQNGSGRPPDRVQRGYPRSPPDTCQLKTDNCQPPSTANHDQPPTANHHQPTTNRQPGQMGPKPVKNGKFQKWSPTLGEGQTDPFGPFWACSDLFQPSSAGLAHFSPVSPGSRDRDGVQHGPKNRSKVIYFRSGLRTLWECETDLKRIQ